jgi:ankyrin repeat protein
MDLILAIRCWDLERVKLLIEEGADVNYKEQNARTPLFWAIECDHMDICRLLIDHGADVNSLNNNGTTPLMWASLNRRLGIIKLLLICGANVHLKNINGHCALDYGFRNYEICRLLCWKGAKYGNNGLIVLIYCKIIPIDLLREIFTKWIS